MSINMKRRFLAGLCLTGLLACHSLFAQPASQKLPETEEPTEQSTDAESEQEKLAKATQNPVAALISLPMKLDWDTGLGSTHADRSLWVVQPVIPISISDKWNMISRTVIPAWIDVSPTTHGSKSTSGMGDVLQSFFFSPKAPTKGGWIWGAGPAINLPTSSEPGLGTDTWNIGPTAVVLKQTAGFTYGALANQLWSLNKNNMGQSSSSMFLQPFLTWTNKKYMTFGINSESTYDWKSRQWTVPVNLFVQQMLKLGKQPLTLQLGYRNYLEAPAGGPNWGIRFQVTLLFPK